MTWQYLPIIATLALVLVAGFRSMPRWGYALGLYGIAAGVLLSTTLAGSQLVGSDIHIEYYYASLAQQSGWDSGLPHAVNTAFSVVMWSPAVADILHVDVLWVFKVVTPLLFAFLPVMLFLLYDRYLDSRGAFFAAFFVIAVPVFSLELSGLVRQQHAELWLVMAFVPLVALPERWGTRLQWLLVCAVGIAVCHYSLGMLFFVYLGGFALWGLARVKREGWKQAALPLLAIAVLFGFCGWYFQWAGAGIVMQHVGDVVGVQVAAFTPAEVAGTGPAAAPLPVVAEFVDEGLRGSAFRVAAGLDFFAVPMEGKAFRILQFLTQGILLLGCVLSLRKKSEMPARDKVLILIGLGLVIVPILLPRVSHVLNMTRFYHLGLLSMAPGIVLGWRWLVRGKHSYKFLSVFMALYFVFTSGAMFELTQQEDLSVPVVPYSIGLSNERVDAGGYLTRDDAAVARWAAEHGIRPIYADIHGVLALQDFMPMEDALPLPEPSQNGINGVRYVFLRDWNQTEGTLAFWAGPGLRRHVGAEEHALDGGKWDLLYSSGSSRLLERSD